MSQPISIPDLLAYGDVLNDIAELVDGSSFRRLLELADALDEIARLQANVRSLVQTEMVKLAEEPVRVGETIFEASEQYKWRPNIGAIERAVIGRACFDDDGEHISNPEQVAQRAVQIMRELYVSPSTEPKAAGLALLGKSKPEVAERKATGKWELKATKSALAPQS